MVLLVSGVNNHPALVAQRLTRMDKETVQVDTDVAATNQAAREQHRTG